MRLQDKHFKLMELLLEGKTQTEAAEILGVSRMTIHRWMKAEEWQEEYRAAIRNHSKNRLKDVVDAMIDASVKEKNAAAAKLIFEMNSLLKKEEKPNVTVKNEINLDKIREELKGL